MKENNKIIKPNANLIFTTIDNKEGILIDIKEGKYYMLNDTLSYIWKNLIMAGLSLRKIEEMMDNKYNILPPILRKNIRTVFRKMMKLKLIKLC